MVEVTESRTFLSFLPFFLLLFPHPPFTTTFDRCSLSSLVSFSGWCRSRSNEDEESKYFLRTKSANETLLRAQEIRTDSYMHTSPTDVDGDVAPDTNLGGAQDVYDDMHSV
jgi:hypothetical protein